MDWVGFMGFNAKKSNTLLNEQWVRLRDWGWLSLTKTLKMPKPKTLFDSSSYSTLWEKTLGCCCQFSMQVQYSIFLGYEVNVLIWIFGRGFSVFTNSEYMFHLFYACLIHIENTHNIMSHINILNKSLGLPLSFFHVQLDFQEQY